MALGHIRVGTQGGGCQERKKSQHGYPKICAIAPGSAYYEQMYPKPPPAQKRVESIAPGRAYYEEIYPKPPPARKRVESIAPGKTLYEQMFLKPPPARKTVDSIAPGRAYYEEIYPKPPPVRKVVESIAPRRRGEYPKHRQHPKATSYQANYRRSPDRIREQPPAQRARRREEPRRRSPSPPKKSIASYREIKALGKGGQGECYLVERRSDGKKFVRKVSHTFLETSNGQPVEARILQDVLGQHTRAIKLIEYALAEDCLITIYDFYPGGDLLSCLPNKYDRQSEKFVWCVFFQLADVLAYLHEGFDYQDPYSTALDWRPVVHCDIKPENVFLRENRHDNPYPNIVLGDFGLATLHPGKHCSGTSTYQSPELEKTGNTKASDIWALGATIHELVHGYTPSKHRGPEPLPKSFSSSLDRMVRSCLTKDPSYRISARELVQRIDKEYNKRR